MTTARQACKPSGIIVTASLGAIHEQMADGDHWREGDGYVSLCPELDIASQGSTVDEARSNLKEHCAVLRDRLERGDRESHAWGSVCNTGGGDSWVSCTALGQEACRIMEPHGFARIRQRGSRIVMQRKTPEGATITVPVPDHNELAHRNLVINHPPISHSQIGI